MSKQGISLLPLTIALTGTVGPHRFTTWAGLLCGLGGHAAGVNRFDGVSGDDATIDTLGTVPVETGGAFAVGDAIQSDASGRAILAVATQTVSAVIAGGAAGDLTVTGITTKDRLVAVVRLDRDSTAANINISNLLSEFTITAANTINNAAGTNTTGDSLLVIYEKAGGVIRGRAMQASTGAGQFKEIFLIQN